MKTKELERRDSSADLIRIVAVVFVISLHFLYHTSKTAENNAAFGFYNLTVEGFGPVEGLIRFIQSGDPVDLHGPLMFLMIMMKVLFSSCVPLFIILTGYLMSRKTLSRQYYRGILKTLAVFALASAVCIVFKAVYFNPQAREALKSFDLPAMLAAVGSAGVFGVKDFLFGILDYSGANYAWYVEMYIGLFLLSPFLNILYGRLARKRHKQVLIATLVILTILPSIVNIFRFDSAVWWLHPATNTNDYQKLIPAFWVGSLYPLTYYFTGAYIREYGIKLKTRSMLPLFLVLLFLFTAFCFYRSYGGVFQNGSWLFWYGAIPCVMGVLLFTMLSRVKANGWSPSVRLALKRVSGLCLGMYLLSFIFDMLIYNSFLNKLFETAYEKLPFFFAAVTSCFLLSMLASFIVTSAARVLLILLKKIKTLSLRLYEESENRVRQNCLFAVLMIFSVLFAVWKAPYGFGGADEMLLLKSQFYYQPFELIFSSLTGSADGIILVLRLFYVAIHGSVSAFIYFRLRKYGYFSVFAAVLYFIFIPYNLMMYTRYSAGVDLIAVSGVLLATAGYKKRIPFILSGAAAAGAVLCCPYAVIFIPLYGIVTAFFRFRNKRTDDIFTPRSFLLFLSGAGGFAVICAVLSIAGASAGFLTIDFGYLSAAFTHPSGSLLKLTADHLRSVFYVQPHFKYAVYAYCLTAAVMLFDRRRRQHRSVYLLVTSGIVIYSLMLLLPYLHITTYNAVMLPPVFIGITSYALCERKPRGAFAGIFVSGIIYSFLSFLYSQPYSVAFISFAAVDIASLIFLGQALREVREKPDEITYAVWVKRLCVALVAVMLIIQGACEIGSAARHCYRDEEVRLLTTEISGGQAKYLITTENKAEAYSTKTALR